MVGLALFALAATTAWLFAARAVQGLAVGAASGAATAALVELAPAGAVARAALRVDARAGGRERRRPADRRRAGRVGAGAAVDELRRRACRDGRRARGRARWSPGCRPATGGAWRLQRPDVPAEIRAAFARFALTAAAAWAVAGLYLSVVPSYAGSLLDTSNLALEGAITATMLLASCAAQVVVRGSGAPARDQSVGLVLVIVGLIALVAAFPAHSLALVLAAALLGGVGHGMAFLGAQSDLNAIAPPDRRGEVTAAFFVCIYLGVAVSAIGVGSWRRWRRSRRRSRSSRW